MTSKVLIAGDVNGCFSELFKRVETVNKKAGPFDALLCVGRFFGPGDEHDEVPADLAQFINGEKKFSVPLYFVGAWGACATTSCPCKVRGGCPIIVPIVNGL